MSPLELCSYCQKSIALSIDVGCSCGAAVITVTAAPASSTAAGDVMGTAGGDLLSSEEHYKKNHNSLKILVAMCHGLKNEDDSDIVIFDKDPWASMKASTYHPSFKVHITQNSQCFTIKGRFHSTCLIKTRFLCTGGVVGWKLTQPLIQRKNRNYCFFIRTEDVGASLFSPQFFLGRWLWGRFH